MKRADHLISAGLLVTAISGTASALALWRADATVSDWSAAPAVAHPVWLGVGDVLFTVAAVVGSVSLASLALGHARSSALATFGLIFLGFAVAGAVLVTVLDFALIGVSQDGVLAAIEFRQHWTWWNALGWLLFLIGGLIAVLAISVGVARANTSLRYPLLSLAVATVLLAVYPPAGAVLLVVALIWIASALVRSEPRLVSSAQ